MIARRRMGIALAVVVAGVGLVAPGLALAAQPWGDDQQIAPRGKGFVDAGGAAIDDRGHAIALWTRDEGGGSRLLGARRTARRSFGEAFTLRDSDRGRVEEPVVAFRDRKAFAAWSRPIGGNDRVEARTIRASGSRSSVARLSGGGSTAFRLELVGAPFGLDVLAKGPSGDLALGWSRGTAGEADLFEQVSTSTGDGFASPSEVRPVAYQRGFAIDVDGSLLVARVLPAGEGMEQLVLQRRGPGEQGFGQPVALSRPRAVVKRFGPWRHVAIEVAPNGAATVVWQERDPTEWRVMAALRQPGGSFGPPQLLGPGVSRLRLAMTADGDPLVAWLDFFGGPVTLVQPGISEPQTVSRPNERVEEFELEADGRGGATIAWVADAEDEPGGPVHAVAITPRGRVGKIQRLSSSTANAREVTLAVGPQGDALAVWADHDRDLRAARRPASD